MPISEPVSLEPRTDREYLVKEYDALLGARKPNDAICKDISDYVVPYASSFTVRDVEKQDKRSASKLILDNSPGYASDVLVAGLLAGKSSPAKPWFKLATPDLSLNKFKPVAEWLHFVTTLMHRIFQASNTYTSLMNVYEQLGNFAIGASIITDDFEDVIRHQTLPYGEYCVATNARGQVDVLFREYEQTVEQCMLKFGKKMSQRVKDHYNRGNYHMKIGLLHAIKPRRSSEREFHSKLAQDMPYMSAHMELSPDPGDAGAQILRMSGFKRFPAIVPRWKLSRSTDAYGNGPGHRALGDVIQLQKEQLMKAKGIDYQSDPPLAIPASLKGRELDTLPGGASVIDGDQSIRTLFEVNLNLEHLLADIGDVRQRIDRAYFKDLFLMLAGQPFSKATATEILSREEEKVMVLGPVLTRLDTEALDKMIDITFDKMIEADLVPPPPQELEGVALTVDYISVLSQAQKATGIINLDRFMTSLGSVAAVKPEILDKVNADEYADVMADILGVDPSIVLSGKEVARIREVRAQTQEQQTALETSNIAADTAAKLSQANMNDDNALNRVLQGLGAS